MSLIDGFTDHQKNHSLISMEKQQEKERTINAIKVKKSTKIQPGDMAQTVPLFAIQWSYPTMRTTSHELGWPQSSDQTI